MASKQLIKKYHVEVRLWPRMAQNNSLLVSDWECAGASRQSIRVNSTVASNHIIQIVVWHFPEHTQPLSGLTSAAKLMIAPQKVMVHFWG
jgi:hypothetical protein